jgi:hypothetical protein
MKKFTIIILGLLSATQSFATEYFVRTDGGTWDQCNGQNNTPYSETVENRNCAVKHIFELLDPQESEVRISGSDIITIMNNSDGSPAEYAMGSHGDYTSGNCNSAWAYSCTMPSPPSGTSEKPTIIRGQTQNGTCSTKPILWGTGRAKNLLTIDGVSNIEVSCLTITDKSSCIGASGYPDSSLICDRSAPYNKAFADTGILVRDSSDIVITDVDVQGLNKGIHAGRLNNITLTRVNLFANYAVGWDGDIEYLGGTGSANTGTMTFKDSSISFNGCGLIYNPGHDNHNQPHACARQDIGGYGDGIGTGETGGNWVFENTKVLHNNSDGIDLLYRTLGGKITIKNSRVEGNAGNQIKVAGNAELTNNIIIANCAWNSRQEASLGGEGEICRAGGNPLSVHFTHDDTQISIINNTVYSEGDVILGSGNRTGVAAGNQSLIVVNNVFYGLVDYRQNFENTGMYYTEDPFPYTTIHNNLIHKPKSYGDPCNAFQSNIPTEGSAGLCTNAGVTTYYDNDDYTVISNPHFPEINLGIQYSGYDNATLENEATKPYPLDTSSPVINAGYSGVVGGVSIPTTDYFGNVRVGNPDIGAIEYAPKPKAPTINNIK